MLDSEKVDLIAEMVANFWEWHKEDYQEKGAFALLTAIATVAEFKRKD